MISLLERSTGAVIDDPVPLTWNEAASGIFGSISMTCWFFLMVPQLIENYKQQSAEAISLVFLMIWFLGDAANLAGSVWANLVPVVVAIAFYFFLADFVFIGQCMYYNIKNSRSRSVAAGKRPNRSSTNDDDDNATAAGGAASPSDVDPTTPLLSRRLSENLDTARRESRRTSQVDDAMIDMIKAAEPSNPCLQNLFVLLAICAVGTAGWTMAWQSGLWKPTPVSLPQDEPVDTPFAATMLGYFSSVCYLGARLPQIYKNYCDKSCEGLSLLFFIMSVMGNVTYGFGILFHSLEKDYIITNLPWLIGSLGTIAEDAIIFLQFRIYAPRSETAQSTA